ncbi:MAG: CBS domain-containing protein [Euryarchaeota archaeon]|nr:CBS domain-containing protein [Euryarchaeota archaeon]
MKTSIQIGKVMGIPIKIHISFLLVLVLFPVVFANDAVFGFADVPSVLLRYALALTLTILLFSCVLLHELGHSWVAMKYGIRTRSITLILHVLFIPEDADAMDALKMMSTGNVGQLLVQNMGSITGMVSRTDLTRSIEVLGYRER